MKDLINQELFDHYSVLRHGKEVIDDNDLTLRHGF